MSKPLSEQVAELEAENAELRAGQGRWPKEHLQPIVDFAEYALAPDPQPSVGDEVTDGDLLDSLPVGTVVIDQEGIRHFHRGVHWINHRYLNEAWTSHELFGEFGNVAIEYLPEDDFPCCSGTPPRLTVHKLNIAPEGSRVDRSGFTSRVKGRDGLWRKYSLGVLSTHFGVTGEELIADGWGDASLTYPGGHDE